MNIRVTKLTTFTFFSANFSKLLPHVPIAEHVAYFREAGRYHRMAHDRQQDEYTLTRLPADGPLQTIRQAPGLVATFHMGAYQLLPRWLSSNGIPLTLLVSADVAARKGAGYREAAIRFGTKGQPLEILQAEDPLVIRKMVRSIQRGNWVLVFLDGNEGAGNKQSATGRTDLVLDFLAHRLRVKTGVAELAYLAKCPIYPLLMLFDDGQMPMPVGLPPLDLRIGRRQDIVQSAMAKLYGWLAGFVYRYPAQWEGWFYVHHDLLHDAVMDHGTLIQQFLPFSVAGRHFMLHRETYSVYPASARIFGKLCDFYDRQVLRND